MKKKILIGTAVATLGIAYWLISPLWHDVVLDEGIPQVRDAMETMDEATRTELDRQVQDMGGRQVDRDEMMPMGPTVIASGALRSSAHDVSGRAVVVQTDAMRYLRFEDLETVNGPDLRIWLASGLSADDVIDLGALRATRGNVNYAIPPGTDIQKYKYAMIWCRAFSVLFSYAELK